MSGQTRTVLEGFSFTECPRWRDGRIWFSDFYLNAVYSAAPDGTDLKVEAEVPRQPSGIGWLPDGRLLVVSMRDSRVLRREADGSLSLHADLAPYVGGYPNDMVVDAHGCAYVGEFGFDLMGGAPLDEARLLRVDPDGSVSVAAEGLVFPNGSVITEESTLIVSETFGNRMSAFDIAADGALANRRTWAEFGAETGERELGEILAKVVVAPDGCCLDAEGALWVADAVGHRVLRVGEGGAIDAEIRPGDGTFACMLGGEDGRTLFICAAPDFHEQARRNAREGRLLAVEVAVPRAGLP
jgi:sugar lactone lactonase YvrE